jgi:hypothetical protein
MKQHEEWPPIDEHLPILRARDDSLAVSRHIPIVAAIGPTIFVRVRRRGERRQDFSRRHRMRGVDELRRQQAGDGPPAPPPGSLDVLL